jgi:predicted small secreted protein
MCASLFKPAPQEHPMKKLALVILMLSIAALTACNTVKGVGQDLQKTGEKIEDAAKKK